jgi:hypothetical protein
VDTLIFPETFEPILWQRGVPRGDPRREQASRRRQRRGSIFEQVGKKIRSRIGAASRAGVGPK